MNDIGKIQQTYIEKYLDIDPQKINGNSDLIKDLFFYRKEINLQNNSKNNIIATDKGNDLGARKETIIKPIYDLLKCTPARNCEYPENKKYALCLTHDIDDIFPPISHKLLSSLYFLKNFNFQGLEKLWNDKKSPYLNFKEIINIEKIYDAKSTFFFLSTSRDIRGLRYNIEDIESELGIILDNECEIGLHGGYYAYNSLKDINNEKARLEKILAKKVIGYRNHYLMFRYPETWELLTKAGFKYDSTQGYSDMVGFRSGLCHPFKPFNVYNNDEIDIVEIPLAVMDMALFDQNKSLASAWQVIKQLIDTVEKYNGVLTILWHNYVFGCPFRENWIKIYKKILQYSYENNAWITSGENIFKYWTKI